MSLAGGTRLGPYEIVSTIGAGAMGVVYRARDTRLGREVAIKVLPEAFAQDADRLGRFEREARAVAAINHPNILAVHDIGSADVEDAHGRSRVTYMVTELLDGETLRNWLVQGTLPLRKSLDLAMQAARGLAAAHDRGIVHRDLKPENIVMLRDGHVKILDFGLAKKEVTAGAGGHGEAHTMAATDAGTILGTVGYMAPEQVRGEVADHRSDLFSLGVVLYELVTGRRAFERTTPAETMAAILRDDPPELDASSSSSTLPPAVTRVLSHALEKEPGNRFQTARDFAFALQALAEPGSGSADRYAEPAPAKKPLPMREVAAWAAAALLGIAAVAGYLGYFGSAAADGGIRKSLVFAPVLPWHDGDLASPAVSPDGSQIAFIDHRAAAAIVVRDVASLTSRLLRGTEGARLGGTFWSPDGRSLGFFSGGKLKTIEIATGRIEQLATATAAYGGSWSSDGTILFSPEEGSGLFRIDAKGGDPVAVTTVDSTGKKEEAHRWPSFLPDGRHFIFVPWSARTVVKQVQLGSLDGQAPVTLFESESAPVVAGHHFIYVRDVPPRLLAQAFDPRTFALVGRASPVIDDDNVAYLWPTGYSMVSASANLIVYSTGKYLSTQLTWVNRSGQSLGAVGEPDVHYDPELSPDGTSLLVEKRDAETINHDVWNVDLTRGVFSRVTSRPSYENSAIWSPDGRRAVFASSEGDQGKVRVKSASGVGDEELLLDRRAYPTDWSRDGRYLLLHTDGGATGLDVWIHDFERKTTAPWLNSTFDEYGARFSPDGKWIAYVSNESRATQVYIRSFPEGASRIQISTAGGTQPFWPKGGNEVFYLAPDTTLMVVDVRPSGVAIAAAAPKSLFKINAEPMRVIRSLYAVAADGQKILLLKPQVDLSASPLVGITNWAERLK
jgi:Tol biopolymer transport system component